MSTVQLLHELRTLGCEDEVKRGVAARVYIDLLDVAKAQEVKTFYDVDLSEIYFTGKEFKDNVEITNVYLPVSSHSDMNFIQMERIQTKLNINNKSIVLCICDASSTVLYYRLTNGFQQNRTEDARSIDS